MRVATRHLYRAGLAALIVSGAAAVTHAAAPAIQALRTVAHGQWELRERGSTAAPKRICISDPLLLMQVRHGGGACARFVIDNQPKRATVHYTCPGAGNGRTTIRVESPVLLNIESQGIANNSPFNVSYEARNTGSCS